MFVRLIVTPGNTPPVASVAIPDRSKRVTSAKTGPASSNNAARSLQTVDSVRCMRSSRQTPDVQIVRFKRDAGRYDYYGGGICDLSVARRANTLSINEDSSLKTEYCCSVG